MYEFHVDFIGGDFNMSAFSTVGDVFSDQEFSAPGNSLLWGLGALEEPNRECAGFSACQNDLTSGASIHMVATNLIIRYLAWDLETNLIFQCSFIFVIPICPDPAASCEVTKHNKEDLSADMTKNVCRDDDHDRAPVHQGHVSVSFLTLLRLRVSIFLVCCFFYLR